MTAVALSAEQLVAVRAAFDDGLEMRLGALEAREFGSPLEALAFATGLTGSAFDHVAVIEGCRLEGFAWTAIAFAAFEIGDPDDDRCVSRAAIRVAKRFRRIRQGKETG